MKSQVAHRKLRGPRALFIGAAVVVLIAAMAIYGGFGGEADRPERGQVVSVYPLLTPGAKRSFASFERSVQGKVGLAVAPLGQGSIQRLGSFQRGHAWSSIKVAIPVTLLRDRASAGLTREERHWAKEALSGSNDFAAALLFYKLVKTHGGLYGASRAMQEVLARAGDTATTVATDLPPSGAFSTYGQTQWSLEGSVRFYRSLARGQLLGPAGTAYILGLMEHPSYWESWGLREAGFPEHIRIAAKAGWGTEGSDKGPYLVRQAGILRVGDLGVVVTMMAQDDTGSFGAAVQDLNLTATWLRHHLSFTASF